MKTRIKIAVTVVALSLIAYPFTNHYAELERGYGYGVFGGEELLLFFGFFIAYIIIVDGLQNRAQNKRKSEGLNTRAFSTESEQRSGERTACAVKTSIAQVRQKIKTESEEIL